MCTQCEGQTTLQRSLHRFFFFLVAVPISRFSYELVKINIIIRGKYTKKTHTLVLRTNNPPRIRTTLKKTTIPTTQSMLFVDKRTD